MYSFYSDFYATYDVFKVIFRVIDEQNKPCVTTPNDRNRQFDLVTSDDLDLR